MFCRTLLEILVFIIAFSLVSYSKHTKGKGALSVH